MYVEKNLLYASDISFSFSSLFHRVMITFIRHQNRSLCDFMDALAIIMELYLILAG